MRRRVRRRDGLRRHRRHRRDDHVRRHRGRRDGHHVWGLHRWTRTAAWASSPGWGEACRVRRRRRDAACAHRGPRRVAVRRGQPEIPRADWDDAAACPCPAPGRRGCCPGGDRSDAWRDQGWVRRAATKKVVRTVRGHPRDADWLQACWRRGCLDVPAVWPGVLPAWVQGASGPALRRALAWRPLEPREPRAQRALTLEPREPRAQLAQRALTTAPG